jgi:hypothetical protein
MYGAGGGGGVDPNTSEHVPLSGPWVRTGTSANPRLSLTEEKRESKLPRSGATGGAAVCGEMSQGVTRDAGAAGHVAILV